MEKSRKFAGAEGCCESRQEGDRTEKARDNGDWDLGPARRRLPGRCLSSQRRRYRG